MSLIHDPLIPHPEALLLLFIVILFIALLQIPLKVWIIFWVACAVLFTVMPIISMIIPKPARQPKNY